MNPNSDCGCSPEQPDIGQPEACGTQCNEIINTQCVLYTGDELICTEEPLNPIEILPALGNLQDILFNLGNLICHGPQGSAATIEIVDVTYQEGPLSVIVDETASSTQYHRQYNFHFIIPKGEQGDTGPQGLTGDDGLDGQHGTDGIDGIDGESAYEIAVDAGFVGTVSEWLLSLVGPQGIPGPQGPTGQDGSGVAGPTGPSGADGTDGIDGSNIDSISYDSVTGMVTIIYDSQAPQTFGPIKGDTGADGQDGLGWNTRPTLGISGTADTASNFGLLLYTFIPSGLIPFGNSVASNLGIVLERYFEVDDNNETFTLIGGSESNGVYEINAVIQPFKGQDIEHFKGRFNIEIILNGSIRLIHYYVDFGLYQNEPVAGHDSVISYFPINVKTIVGLTYDDVISLKISYDPDGNVIDNFSVLFKGNALTIKKL